MRYILLSLVLIIASIGTSAHATTTHAPNDAKISIKTPSDLPKVVQDTLQSRIDKYLSRSTWENTLTTATVGTGITENPNNWEYSVDVKKIYSDASITSLLMTTYEYTGGAHGMTSRVGLVVDNTTGKLLSLKDFYNTQKLVRKLSPVWQLQIRAKLAAALGQKLTPTDKEWIRQGTLAREQYESFVLTEKSIIIYGQDYQHAPRAYGTFTLIYPRKSLESIEIKK